MTTQQDIEDSLRAHFAPDFLDVENESHQHSVPANSETHFRVVLVSAAFAHASRVVRHQQVYKVLAKELQGPVHALALHTYAPDEWEQRRELAPDSPACLGGSASEVR